jgi:MtfA peptidase
MRAWPPRTILLHRIAAVVIGGLVALVASAIGNAAAWSLLGLVVGGAYYAASTRRYRSRRRLLASPLPESDRATLRQRIVYYREIDDAARERFDDDVRIFLAEQVITGAADQEVDHSTRLLIAASAAMLSNALPDWEWPRMRDIVVYPHAFDDRYDTEEHGNVAGQVSLYGPILFSKRDLELGFRRREGHNVGLHELAHVIDMEDGHADGVPVDAPFTASAPWVDVVAKRLETVRRGKSSPLRDYAGTNVAEVFAVAVEVFFEKPGDLARRDPELFELLCRYFNQDPRRPGRMLDA